MWQKQNRFFDGLEARESKSSELLSIGAPVTSDMLNRLQVQPAYTYISTLQTQLLQIRIQG